ncbi:hypothetical protein [Anaeromusa sp.]|uniref:hypothetical protein n=1 Tax=Anaeromusa sp. TaxID=1872520 RepID=UPI0026353713|nr:hypothetical protein [Anaeromusa sp.]MDD3158825.1 hypothetical protein [Anaeromusa sp.]
MEAVDFDELWGVLLTMPKVYQRLLMLRERTGLSAGNYRDRVQTSKVSDRTASMAISRMEAERKARLLRMARRWIEIELPVAGRVLLLEYWRGHEIEEAAKEARLQLGSAMKVWVQMGNSMRAFAAAEG